MNVSGACEDTGEWVERGMELADELVASAAREAFQPGGFLAARSILRAHLESQHLATKALAKQLAEALKWMVQRTDEGGYPDGRCLTSARAAMAAHQQYVALQEKT